MMLLILSDSHGSTVFLEQALKRERGADIIVHLGDGADDLDMLREFTGGRLVYQCSGNMDIYRCDYSERCIFPAENVTVFACHGHRYDVKSGLYRLSLAAREQNARICLFGHTHSQFADDTDGLLLLNPGSIRKGDYAVVTVTGENVSYKLKQI